MTAPVGQPRGWSEAARNQEGASLEALPPAWAFRARTWGEDQCQGSSRDPQKQLPRETGAGCTDLSLQASPERLCWSEFLYDPPIARSTATPRSPVEGAQ